MKNNKGFTLIELLAVIVVLAIVSVLATRSILPYMTNARPDAFGIEATNIIQSATDAVGFYNLKTINVDNDANSCVNGNLVCFSVAKLIDLGLYKGDKGTYKGTVYIDTTNTVYTYRLNLQKGAEFSIVNSTETDFVNNKTDIKTGGFADADFNTLTTCKCS